MKRKIASLSFLSFGIFYMAVHAANSGFAGKWALDAANPRPGDAPNHLVTKIKSTSRGLTIESTFREPDNGIVPLLYLGVMTTTLQLDTDGGETRNQVGPFQIASRTTLTNSHQMDTVWKGVLSGDPVEGHWTHKLSEDGRRMTLEIDQNSTNGRSGHTTLYFVRK